MTLIALGGECDPSSIQREGSAIVVRRLVIKQNSIVASVCVCPEQLGCSWCNSVHEEDAIFALSSARTCPYPLPSGFHLGVGIAWFSNRDTRIVWTAFSVGRLQLRERMGDPKKRAKSQETHDENIVAIEEPMRIQEIYIKIHAFAAFVGSLRSNNHWMKRAHISLAGQPDW